MPARLYLIGDVDVFENLSRYEQSPVEFPATAPHIRLVQALYVVVWKVSVMQICVKIQ